MILPNVIIAGAPRCGTTSLFSYLAAHSAVCSTNVEEARYLIDPGYPLFRPEYNFDLNGFAGYEKFFEGCTGDSHKIFLEATPDYLYQKKPLEVIPTWPEPVLPEILFILRKPSERVYSLFHFAKYNMAILDKNLTFFQFLEMIREKNKTLQNRSILLNAINHSRYYNYLKMWVDVIGEKKVHFLLFEDMVDNPERFMKSVASVIGIHEEFYDTYPYETKNRTVVVRNTLFHRLLIRSRVMLLFKRRFATIIKKGNIGRIARRVYESVNLEKKSSSRTAEDVYLLKKLDEDFRPYNKKLKVITNLNLDRWD